MKRRILLVGATGTFGSQLATMLAKVPDIELMLTARGTDALNALRRSLLETGAVAGIVVRSFDRSRPEGLADIGPWLVVDAAGPFQGSDYSLALTAVRAGAHYIDLADGRGYVAGFAGALDEAAREAGVIAVTAASSTPALSHAALAPLVEEWSRIDEVLVAISPGARAPRGLSVVEAILSYVGRPVRMFRDGSWQTVPGWSGLRKVHMPGLGSRYVSICETPDMDLLPQRFPIRRDALFMAGLEVAPMHLGLAMLGLSVRWRLLVSLRPFARPLRALSGIFAVFGSDRGGMIVEVSGHDERDRRIRARWALWADAGAGPNTPAAPAAALVRALLEGRESGTGARACVGLLDVGDIMRELARLPIYTRVDHAYPGSPTLFVRLLGKHWAMLPASVRAVHGGGCGVSSGRAVARIGASPPARTMRLLLGLPRSGMHAISVHIETNENGETWTRCFGPSRFTSRLTDGNRERIGLFEERFGPLRFTFDMRPADKGLVWDFVGWSIAGLPLPRRLAPRIRAGAEDADGRYRFRVVAVHRWLGLLFAYRGTLDQPSTDVDPAETTSSSASAKLPL